MCYLQNRIVIKLKRKSLKKVFISHKLSVQYLQMFKYIVYINILFVYRDKLDLISYKTILVRYLLILK